MARELSPKGKLIREVLGEHPDWGNKDVADWINESKKLDGKGKPQDIPQAEEAMKKAGESRLSRVPPAEEGGEEQASTAGPTAQPTGEGGRGLTREDLVQLQGLVGKAGGISELIGWLEMLRGFQQ